MGKKDLFAKEILLGPKEYPIKIQIKTFKGKKYLDIRKWFLDRSTNEVVPTKKGIMLSDYQFNDVFETVGKEKELINNWFQNKEEEDEVVQRISRHSDIRKKLAQEAKEYKTFEKKLDNKKFFDIEYKNNESKFIFNKNHELYKNISKINGKDKELCIKIIESMLISFHQSLQLFDTEEKIDFKDLEEILNENWSIILKNYLKREKT